MIDWLDVGANALWILGSAVVLAVLSYASWEASEYQGNFSARMRRPALQAVLYLGGFLFSCGLAATSSRPLEVGLWLLLAVLFLFQTFVAWNKSREHVT